MFTASEFNYAEAFTNSIDPENNYIKRIMYRDHCIHKGDKYIKDLRVLKDVPLSQVIIIDNLVVSFAAQLENGIYIPSYTGQSADTELKTIADFLVTIADVTDVRPFVKKFSGIPKLYDQFLIASTLTIKN